MSYELRATKSLNEVNGICYTLSRFPNPRRDPIYPAGRGSARLAGLPAGVSGR